MLTQKVCWTRFLHFHFKVRRNLEFHVQCLCKQKTGLIHEFHVNMVFISCLSGWPCPSLWLHCGFRALWTYTFDNLRSSWACTWSRNTTGKHYYYIYCILFIAAMELVLRSFCSEMKILVCNFENRYRLHICYQVQIFYAKSFRHTYQLGVSGAFYPYLFHVSVNG